MSIYSIPTHFSYEDYTVSLSHLQTRPPSQRKSRGLANPYEDSWQNAPPLGEGRQKGGSGSRSEEEKGRMERDEEIGEECSQMLHYTLDYW